jgi:hypothetical protein
MKHKNNGIVPDGIWMSRRDQIAAQVLSGVMAGAVSTGEPWTVEDVSQIAVECSDALIDRLDNE